MLTQKILYIKEQSNSVRRFALYTQLLILQSINQNEEPPFAHNSFMGFLAYTKLSPKKHSDPPRSQTTSGAPPFSASARTCGSTVPPPSSDSVPP